MTHWPDQDPHPSPLELDGILDAGLHANKKFPLAFAAIAPAVAHALTGSGGNLPDLVGFARAQLNSRQLDKMQRESFADHTDYEIPVFPQRERYEYLWFEYKRNALSLIARLLGVLRPELIERRVPQSIANAPNERDLESMIDMHFRDCTPEDWRKISSMLAIVDRAVTSEVAGKIENLYKAAISRLFRHMGEGDRTKMRVTGVIPEAIRKQLDEIMAEHVAVLVVLIVNDLKVSLPELADKIQMAFSIP